MPETQTRFQSVDDVLAAMPTSFCPDACRDAAFVVHWKLSEPDAREFTVYIDRGTYRLQEGGVEKADLCMEASSDTYVRLANGQISGIVAIMTRKLRVRGNVQLAAQFDRVFK